MIFSFRILSVFKFDSHNVGKRPRRAQNSTGNRWYTMSYCCLGHDQYLGNFPPTPPLTEQQSIDNKSRLMLG